MSMIKDIYVLTILVICALLLVNMAAWVILSIIGVL